MKRTESFESTRVLDRGVDDRYSAAGSALRLCLYRVIAVCGFLPFIALVLLTDGILAVDEAWCMACWFWKGGDR